MLSNGEDPDLMPFNVDFLSMSALFAKIKQQSGTERHHNKEMACDL